MIWFAQAAGAIEPETTVGFWEMKYDSREVLEALDTAWDPECGFLGNLREGNCLPELGDSYPSLLGSIEIPEGERLHADFVRLLGFAPQFFVWHIQRAVDRGADRIAVSKHTVVVGPRGLPVDALVTLRIGGGIPRGK
ncbi:hypothetical protein ACFO5K_10730 [Nocardia halotolerans]|uniref:Uncharacterized protein n=1 Tax=Nocardia halotolerans TaxID=1755878 RepID=A0ABV8VHQ1_9NOCA